MITTRDDFPDWMPPVLVKELRQGMRTSFFTGIFVTLQALLAVTMGAAMAADSGSSIGEAVSQILFAVFGVVVLLVQPLRLVNTLDSDKKSGAMEMMAMTRQGAMRIILGKWVAIAVQTALLFFTFLPYVILRYFFGGMDLAREGLFLTILFLISLMLSAVTLGLSACKSPIVRYGMPLLVFPLTGLIVWFMMLPATIAGMVPNPFSLQGEIRWIGLAVAAGLMTYYGYSLLSAGASLISEPSENRVAVRRLVPLVVILAMFWIEIPPAMNKSMHYLVCTLVVSPALVLALTETTPPLASTRARFAKFGLPGKIAGIFLMPTRASGLFFALGLFALLFVLIVLDSGYPVKMGLDHAEGFHAMTVFPAALLFPAVCQSLLPPRLMRRGLTAYLKMGIVSVLVLLFSDAIPGVRYNRDVLAKILCWHPAGANLLYDHQVGAGMLSALIPVYCLVLLLSAVREMKRERPLGAEAETMTDS